MTVVHPHRLLVVVLGTTTARLLTFLYVVLRQRPEIAGGFHIINGMAAALGARLIGSRSLYSCCGGPAEIIDGGIHSDNRMFTRLQSPDRFVERHLARAVADVDIIATRGRSAAEYFRALGIERNKVVVITGGVDSSRVPPTSHTRGNSLLLVGRMASVKRPDVFVKTVAAIAHTVPDVSAALVGDGPLRQQVQEQAAQLGVADRIHFAGHQRDLSPWLNNARVFTLTSDREGLSLALIEAMMRGIPAVVSDVGDLRDLVVDGRNGYVVPRRDVTAFANKITALLTDAELWTEFSREALRSAARYETARVAERWDSVFSSVTAQPMAVAN